MLYDKMVKLLPGNKLSENALYWKGENYYSQKKYYEAIEQFNKTLNNSFTHKDDAALFKIGMCYFEQDMFEASLKYFQKIIDYYPDSIHKERAKEWKRQGLREIKYRY